jgi:hypothetical protein
MKDHWNFVRRGDRFTRVSDGAEVRVMGVVDRYAVVRRKQAAPFLVAVRSLRHGIEWKPTTALRDAEKEKGNG